MQQPDRNYAPGLAWSFGVGEQDGRSRHRTDVEARDVPLDGNIFSAVRCWLSGQYYLLFSWLVSLEDPSLEECNLRKT